MLTNTFFFLILFDMTHYCAILFKYLCVLQRKNDVQYAVGYFEHLKKKLSQQYVYQNFLNLDRESKTSHESEQQKQIWYAKTFFSFFYNTLFRQLVFRVARINVESSRYFGVQSVERKISARTVFSQQLMLSFIVCEEFLC